MPVIIIRRWGKAPYMYIKYIECTETKGRREELPDSVYNRTLGLKGITQ